MTPKEYQDACMKNAVYSGHEYPKLGLLNEIGEVAGKIKKNIRDSTPLDFEAIRQEIGDVLWYAFACAFEFGIELPDSFYSFEGTRQDFIKNILATVDRALNFIKSQDRYSFLELLCEIDGLCSNTHCTLEEVAKLNVKKLNDRAARGVLKGSGDNR